MDWQVNDGLESPRFVPYEENMNYEILQRNHTISLNDLVYMKDLETKPYRLYSE